MRTFCTATGGRAVFSPVGCFGDGAAAGAPNTQFPVPLASVSSRMSGWTRIRRVIWICRKIRGSRATSTSNWPSLSISGRDPHGAFAKETSLTTTAGERPIWRSRFPRIVSSRPVAALACSAMSGLYLLTSIDLTTTTAATTRMTIRPTTPSSTVLRRMTHPPSPSPHRPGTGSSARLFAARAPETSPLLRITTARTGPTPASVETLRDFSFTGTPRVRTGQAERGRELGACGCSGTRRWTAGPAGASRQEAARGEQATERPVSPGPRRASWSP